MYWKTLLQDYKEVGKDSVKEIRTRPLKAFVIFSGFVFAGCSSARNPDEKSYRDSVINYATSVLLVDEKIRNINAVNYMKYVENSHNTDILRYFSFGLFSIVYKSKHDRYSGLYEAQCSYVQTPYLQFHKQIVDIGFWNKWWILEREMKDYDVSLTEWPEEKLKDEKEDKTLTGHADEAGEHDGKRHPEQPPVLPGVHFGGLVVREDGDEAQSHQKLDHQDAVHLAAQLDQELA
ncbi:hypothetical protein B566_EDAN016264 [Ephemera danica]|nr:hypothetical protein B566_EDAN016264 [Ephemera danica]